MTLWEFVIAFIALVPVTMFIHEQGHVWMFSSYGRDVKIRYNKGCIEVGKNSDYEGLNNYQLGRIYFAGIFLGLIPMALLSVLFTPAFMLLLPSYAIWCKEDIKSLKGVMRT